MSFSVVALLTIVLVGAAAATLGVASRSPRVLSRLSDDVRRRAGYLLIGIALAISIAATIIWISVDELSRVDDTVLLGVAFGVVLFISMRAAPRNGAVWALTWAALLGVTGDLVAAVAFARTGFTTLEFENAADIESLMGIAPSDLDTLSAFAISISSWTWIPSIFLIAIHTLVLFPNGFASSDRWRRLLWVSGISMALMATAATLNTAPWVSTPYSETYASDAGAAGAFSLAMLVLLGAAAASLVHMIVRFRRSVGIERLQYRWVTYALALNVVAIFLYSLIVALNLPEIVQTLVLVTVPISFGIAITKYRLFDIDLVISRTLVYAFLIVLIAVVYVGVVAVPLLILGETEGVGTQPTPLLAIAATALIAIAFQPVRRRLERAANRIVYGKRATPYEVLSEFTRRVAATDDDLLEQVPESLVAGTSAETAAVWVRNGSAWSCTNSFPADAVPQSFPGFVESANGLASVPVEHDGEIMGAVTLQAPRAQRLSPDDERLARQVASGMGLALRNQRLTEDLRNRVELLRDSRRRIVAVQDDTRRDLERDLHDGAQQQLVAVKVKLGIARQLAERDSAEATISAVTAIAGDADRAIEDMRAFARGVYPPLLEAEGLVAALTAQARRLPITVEMSGSAERHGRDVESTMYFCVVEALRNVVQHSRADLARVALGDGDSVLTFAVTDAGPGFDPARTLRGSGLVMMEDRLDVLGGTLIVGSTPTGPTSIQGTIPTDTHPMRSAPFSGVAP